MEKPNPLKCIGSYIGAFVGLLSNYFMFGYLFYLAEIGRFEPWGLLLLVPIFIGFFIGYLVQLFFLSISENKTNMIK